jgi:pyruvate dehydrogenase E2 component (dihydrolipoamide acetyltransferase)
MAKINIVMPQMGESITTGTITKWHKKAGDTIKLDEILFEISTDKVESEIPSPFAGRIDAILFPEGATVDVGKAIAILEDDLSAPAASAPVAAPVKVENKTQIPASASTSAPAVTHEEHSGERRFYTPLVKKLAQEAGVSITELNAIKGSGAGGRVNREDFEKYLSTRGSKPAMPAAPVAAANTTTVSVSTSVQIVDGYKGKTEIIPMDNMRKAIAKNMVASKQISPHVNSVDEIDMTNLVKFREGFKAEFQKQEGFNLTYTPFILYALIQALREYPRVNASLDGDNIILKKDINIGCAVAVPGNGLVVPIIHSADNLNMLGLCRMLDLLAKKARAKKLTMDELSGGTFTFTNVGSFGTLLATPVILQPQLGIFAAGVIKKRVMVMDNDTIGIRSMMYGTHTYDHRLIDGELGGLFLNSVKKHLESMDAASLF